MKLTATGRDSDSVLEKNEFIYCFSRRFRIWLSILNVQKTCIKVLLQILDEFHATTCASIWNIYWD